MKVGDLVRNTFAVDDQGLGIIIEVGPEIQGGALMWQYKVQWINPPRGCAESTWNNTTWIERIE